MARLQLKVIVLNYLGVEIDFLIILEGSGFIKNNILELKIWNRKKTALIKI